MGDEQSITRGSICHVEVPAPDLEAMQAFYAYFRDPCGNKMGVWSRS